MPCFIVVFPDHTHLLFEKCIPGLADDLNEYQKIRNKLNEYYLQIKNNHFKMYVFLKL